MLVKELEAFHCHFVFAANGFEVEVEEFFFKLILPALQLLRLAEFSL